MSRKKPHLHEIVNKANVFNLEAAMKQMFERSKSRGRVAPHIGDWDPTFALRCAGLEGANKETEMKFFNQSCVGVVMILEDKEKVVQVLDYLIKRVACGSLRCKLQVVLSVFLNYNAAEKTVRKEFMSAVVKKNRDKKSAIERSAGAIKRSAESKHRIIMWQEASIVSMDPTDVNSESKFCESIIKCES
jgi:hypothetical protein